MGCESTLIPSKWTDTNVFSRRTDSAVCRASEDRQKCLSYKRQISRSGRHSSGGRYVRDSVRRVVEIAPSLALENMAEQRSHA